MGHLFVLPWGYKATQQGLRPLKATGVVSTTVSGRGRLSSSFISHLAYSQAGLFTGHLALTT